MKTIFIKIIHRYQSKFSLLIIGGFFIAIFNCTGNKTALQTLNGPIPGLNKNSTFLIYYGDWDAAKIKYAKNYDLVILHSYSNIDREMAQHIRNGKDNIPNTKDDIYVVAYISVGEEYPGPVRNGNGRGPVTYKNGQLFYKNLGAASYYLDANDDGEVDVNGIWKSFYVNAADTSWHNYLKKRDNGFDYINDTLGCDGFFLDTIDSATPGFKYDWMLEGMSTFIKKIRDWYPQKIIIANRGLFYFMENSKAYPYTIRPYVNAVMFECFYTEWDWEYNRGKLSPWFTKDNKPNVAPQINREAQKKDGFTVLCLDYLSQEQENYQEMLTSQTAEVAAQPGWLNCITDVQLKNCHNDVSGF